MMEVNLDIRKQGNIWISKLDETSLVTLEVGDASWKIWTRITEEPHDSRVDTSYRFKFIVQQITGKRVGSKIVFMVGKDSYEIKYHRYSTAEEYSFVSNLPNDHQFLIRAHIRVSEPLSTFDALKTSKFNYFFQVGDARFGVYESMWPISEKLTKLVDKRPDNLSDVPYSPRPNKRPCLRPWDEKLEQEVIWCQLYGVDCKDLRAVIDDPSLENVDITVDKCRSFAEIERRYGIKYYSEKVRKMLEMDFWYNTDKSDGKIMCNEEIVTVTVRPEMKISKTFRAPSLPNKYTINAFGIDFDIYMYIQEYNGTSYLSIGVIYDESTDNKHWSTLIYLNIQLHHKNNPQLNKSAVISREFNNYQRSAGCPTFMLSNELGDYCQRDGSFVITISLSPAVVDNNIQYPGIKDLMVSSGNKKVMVSRDLLLHYCAYFKTLPATDNLSADLFPFDRLTLLLDLIYHRSLALTITNIKKLLIISEAVICPYAYNHCDKLLANHYHSKFLSINRTKEFLEIWDLPQLKEAEKIMSYEHPKPKYMKYERKVFNDEYPKVDRTVKLIGLKDVLEVILPSDVIDSQKMEIILKTMRKYIGFIKLDQYRKALSTLEGIPQRLKNDLKVLSGPTICDPAKLCGLTKRLDDYGKSCGDGGCPELAEQAEEQQKLVRSAIKELSNMFNSQQYRLPGAAVDKLLSVSDKAAEQGRRAAAELLWKMMQEDGVQYSKAVKGNTILEGMEDDYWTKYSKYGEVNLDEWLEYIADNTMFFKNLCV